MSTTQSGKRLRPLSPHLQIYRKQLTSTLSILHRATGIWLSLGLILLVDWLLALADPNERGYTYFTTNLDFGLGAVALVCLLAVVSFAIFYALEMIYVARVPAPQRTWLKLFFVFLDLGVALLIGVKGVEGVGALAPDALAQSCDVIGKLMLVAWTWSFFYHFCAGLRHLAWDSGLFLGLRDAYATGWIAVGLSLLITAWIWVEILGWQI